MDNRHLSVKTIEVLREKAVRAVVEHGLSQTLVGQILAWFKPG